MSGVPEAAAGGDQRFVSFRWKILGIVLALLGALLAASYWLTDALLSRQLASQLVAQQAAHTAYLKAALDRDARATELVGQLLAPPGSARADIVSRLSGYWPMLMADLQLARVGLYDPLGRPMGMVDDGVGSFASFRADFQRLSRRTLLEDRPLVELVCHDRCLMLTAAPMFVDDQVGAMVLSRYLDPLLARFHADVGAELALADPHRSIWLASSQRLRGLFGAPPARMGAPLNTDGRWYAAGVLDAGVSLPSGAVFVSLADISDAVALKASSERQFLQAASLGVLLLTALLARFLFHTSGRVTRVAAQLPALTARRYDAVREALRLRENRWHRDELDLVDEALVQAAEDLDAAAAAEAHARQLLERHLALLTAQLEATRDGVVVVDDQGAVQLYNCRVGEFFGLAEGLGDRVLRRRLYRRLRRLIDEPMGLVQRLLHTRSQGHEETVETNDGRIFALDSRPLRVRDARGQMITIRDLTHERRTELGLRQQTQARRQAEALAEARTRYLADVSHELRTPLQAMTGLVELLRSSNLGVVQHQRVEMLYQTTEALLELVEQVLDLSRIDLGGVAVQPRDFDLGELLCDMTRYLHQITLVKELSGHVEADGASPALVRGDCSLLRQLLMNLLGNAVKFTDTGQVVLHVRARADRLQFRVEDTGPGMAPDVLERVFEPMVQGDGSRGGLGLGMTICKRLVDLLGGEIEIESAPGVGTTVSVGLPLALAESADDPSHCAPPSPSRRVLLLDDGRGAGALLQAQAAEAGVVMELVTPEQLGLCLDMAAGSCEYPVLVGTGSALRAVFDHLTAAQWSALFDQVCGVFAMGYVPMDVANAYRTRVRFYGRVPDHTALPPLALGLMRRALAARPGDVDLTATVSGQRLLLAEDDAVTRSLLSEALENHGFVVHAVADGNEALRAIRGVAFDVILLDSRMPGLDGVEVLERLHVDGGAVGSALVVMLTGNASNALRERAQAAGVELFLTKPIPPSELVQRLSEQLGAGGAHCSAGAQALIVPPGA